MLNTKAVRVACNGETPGFVRAFQEYNIPSTHDIYDAGQLSQISAVVGVPLLLMKLRPSLLTPDRRRPQRPGRPGIRYGYTEDGAYYQNEIAMLLMGGNADTCHLWNDRTGSVLIARQDGKPLHAAHVSMLIDFLKSAFRFHQETGIQPSLTPDFFKSYCDSVTKSSAQGGQESEVPSPFEVADIEKRRDSAVA